MICPKCKFTNNEETVECENCNRPFYRSKLRIILENGDNNTSYLYEKKYTLGRSKDNDITILDDSISRHHAEIFFEDGLFSITDLNSKNGSLINNIPLNNSILRHDDCLQLGNVVVHYHDEENKPLNNSRFDTMEFVQQEYFKLTEERDGNITTEDVLHTVLELGVSLIGAEQGAILELMQPARLKYKLGRGFAHGQTEINTILNQENELFQNVIKSRKIQIQWDATIQPADNSETVDFNWKLIAVPLLPTIKTNGSIEQVNENQLLGVCFFSNRGKSKLSRRKKELLNALSQQMALAMENDNLDRIKIATGRKRHELKLSMDIKQRLLPIAQPDYPDFNIVSFVEPCETISGDYFDVIQISNKSIGFAIGDICGKGIPAALLSSTAQAAIRSQAELSDDPAKIIMSLNQTFIESTASSVFLTLFFGILDLNTNQLSYVNAGHPPPIFVSKERKINELMGTMQPIGIIENRGQIVKTISFAPGDMLFLYTDGVIESLNNQREAYGRKRLNNRIKAIFDHPKANRYNLNYIIEKIKSDLMQHTHGANQIDDLTLLAIKRKQQQ